MDQSTIDAVELWSEKVQDPELAAELAELKAGDEEALNDACYRSL